MASRRPHLLLGTLAVGLATAVALAAPARAESISSITVEATVNADTTIHTVETIVYDFGGESRHGIYRDLVAYDVLPSEDRQYYDVSVASVTQDGQPATYEQLDEGQYLRLKIGDPGTTITGSHTYVIDYTIANGLRTVTAADMKAAQMPAGVSEGDVELYWDLVGTGWPVPIDSAQSTIGGPAPPLTASCFYGAGGATSTCTATTTGTSTALGPVTLGAYEGLTGSIIYPRSAFTTTPVQVIKAPPAVEVPAGVWTFLGSIPFAGGLLVIPGIVAAFLRRKDKGVDLNAEPPQYGPPDDLAPAQMVAAWKGTPAERESRVLVATLLDLTARGWLTMSTDSGLTVARTAGGTGEPREWEQGLLDTLIPNGSTVVFEKYDKEHTEIWEGAYAYLVSEAEQSGRRNPAGDKPDKRWNPLAIVALVALALGIGSTFFGLAAVAAFFIPIGIAALIGFFIARAITPRQETQQSAEFLAKVRGLERVLSTDPSSARRELALRLGLPPVAVMATMLPFALVFKLENSWMGAFPDLTPNDLATTGFGMLTMYDLGNMVSSSNTFAQAATTSPSSGSGGGGYSGGGGGGGGGGSW
jgi:hypothetical protein